MRQKVEIATYLVTHPNEAYHDFHFDFTGGDDFNTTDPGIVFSELGKAFGHVTIFGSMTARCSPIGPASDRRFLVSPIDFSGSFEDLYDFRYAGGANYYGGLKAACVQAGYASLSTPSRPSGRVFKTRVEFQATRPWGFAYDGSSL